MTSKVLKLLTSAELLVSHRGAHGGYGLARDAGSITVAEVIEALDGPIAITSCTEPTTGRLQHLSLCPARANWERINLAIREALGDVTLAEMAHTIPAAFLLPGEQRLMNARS